jgi:hypothetical protein
MGGRKGISCVIAVSMHPQEGDQLCNRCFHAPLFDQSAAITASKKLGIASRIRGSLGLDKEGQGW